MRQNYKILALLGPTNTGKTFNAIKRMLGYDSGIIGLPLRLLAREVFDKLTEMRGSSVVALVTGEERIIPKNPKYWVCTVEAMPMDLGLEFVAIDEIQLCSDHERGHIFTDRLLNARGKKETMFMGSEKIFGVDLCRQKQNFKDP
jgi:ATP-dependent RNA helicase SUPV3L1/SUV3